MAKIRSDDIAEKMVTFAKYRLQTTHALVNLQNIVALCRTIDSTVSKIWLAPLDSSNGYTIFNNTVSTDGQFFLTAFVTGGVCTALTGGTTANHFTITDYTNSADCSQNAPYFCEACK